MLNKLRQLLPENSRQYREETSQRISWGHWFALFNIVLALLISSRYAFNSDWPNTLFGKLYFFISLFGHFSFVVFALYLLLLFPLSFIIQNHRAFRGISVCVATIGMTALLVDTEVFKQFYLHLSPLVWDLLVNPTGEGELTRQWQLLFVPMPLILLAEMLYSRWCWHKLRSFNRQKWGKYVALVFLSCFTATHLLYAWADMALYRPITAQKANYPLAYPMTARSFLEKHGLIDRAELEQRIEERGRLDAFFLNYPKHSLRYAENIEQQPKINVMMINVSGLSNEMITPETMPDLSNIAHQSRRFMQHYSGGDTVQASIASLFYGISGRYVDSILNEQDPSMLTNTLQKFNYQFGVFSYNGFAEHIYQQIFAGLKLPKSRSNTEAIEQWQTWLAQRNDQPMFSYLELALPPLEDESKKLRVVDWQLANIWQQLENAHLLHNTLVIITSDIATPAANSAALTNGNSFDPARIKVPMIVYWQGDAGTYTDNSSHMDVVPTVLSQFFGVISPASDYSQGLDLTKEHRRLWVLSSNYKWDVAIMSDGEQYHIDRKGDFEHYNAEGEKQSFTRPPLALFLQLIQQSNEFVEK